MSDTFIEVHYMDGENGLFVEVFETEEAANAFRAEHADVLATPQGEPLSLPDATGNADATAATVPSAPAPADATPVAADNPAVATGDTGAAVPTPPAETVTDGATAAPDDTAAADGTGETLPTAVGIENADGTGHEAVAPPTDDGPVTAENAPPATPVVPSDDGAAAAPSDGSGDASTDAPAAQ